MKYFVFSDVHGYYSLLKRKLAECGFNENNKDHMLISLGDNFDRGIETLEMLEFLKRMKEKNKIILIKGNHEDLFEIIIKDKTFYPRDFHNKTYDTFCHFAFYLFPEEGIQAFYTRNDEFKEKLRELGVFDLFDSMVNFYETKDYVFTHGFIPTITEGKRSYYNMDWRTVENWWDAKWSNGMEKGDIEGIGEPGKKIVCGHFHSSYGNARKILKDLDPSFNINDKALIQLYEFEDKKFDRKVLKQHGLKRIFDTYYGENVIAIDACTAYSNQINLFIFEE